MSAITQSIGLPADAKEAESKSSLRTVAWIGGSVIACALASAFFGINDYASGTAAAIASAQRNAQRFEAVYTDSAENKLAALRLGVDLILANSDLTGAFSRDDRAGLVKAAVPLFSDTLKPRFGLDQLNFWTPPAKLYLRSSDPKEFGTDGAAARRSIVAANERRAALSGMETGLGGRLTIRAMAPVLDGTHLVGVVELGDDLVALLRRAKHATGVEFAAGLDRKRSDEVERVSDKASDAIQGTDVFFEYSSDAAGRMARAISFNARDTAGQLVQVDGHAIYVKPFGINNFSGAPTVVVATLFELTQPFSEARQSAAIKGGVLFLVLSVTAVLALLQFKRLQAGFARVVFGERRKLQDTARELDVLRARLKDVEVTKLGYFNNLVAAVTEPLQAVSGQLSAALPRIADGLRAGPGTDERGRQDLLGRLDFALAEIGRLTRLMADFRKIETMRQNLVQQPTKTVRLSDVVASAIAGELARYGRLPDLAISAEVPAALPTVRASQESLRWAIAGLVSYAAQKGGHGTIRLVGEVDDGGWVTLRIAGTAFAAAGAPTAALLDATHQFMARLSADGSVPENGIMIALVLSRMIVEKAGGHLNALPTAEGGPGFVLRLPAAA